MFIFMLFLSFLFSFRLPREMLIFHTGEVDIVSRVATFGFCSSSLHFFVYWQTITSIDRKYGSFLVDIY